MIKINKNTMDIEVTAGDTATFSFSVKNKDTGKSFLNDGDTITFTLKEQNTGLPVLTPIVVTEFPNDEVIIPITATDTASLIPEHTYIYDIVLTRADGTVDTLNPTDKFFSYFTVKRGVKNG